MTKNIAYIATVFVGAIATSTAATTLIDDSTRNGGFESGAASPWGGITVVTDTTLARTGSNYASASGNRANVFQFIPISTTNGLEFALSFWARIPDSNGFDSLSVSLSDNGFSRTATITTLSQPPLSSSEWRMFEYELTIPTDWNDSGNSRLSIAFPNSGTSRSAFLDDATLTQVPEPSSAGLLMIAFACLSAHRKRLARS